MKPLLDGKSGLRLQSIAWDDELCAEHDGSIASFEKLALKPDGISDYNLIFERRKINVLRIARIGLSVIAGAMIFAPLAFLAAPGFAAAIGATGLLGEAGTGTAIVTLSGGALTNASLAAIGGSMAAGVVIITAVGAALGGYKGAIVSNAYFGQIKDFRICKFENSPDSQKQAVVVINGWGDLEVSEWERSLQEHFGDRTWYYVEWETTMLRKLGSMAGNISKRSALKWFGEWSVQASRRFPKLIGRISIVDSLSDLLPNPWHISMVKAQMVGVMLADAISRNPDWQFTLVGHSLGARAIYYALEALSTKDHPMIDDVYLLGGAVGGGEKDNLGWETAAKVVRGRIYNCYSRNDAVLKNLYKPANVFMSEPAGREPIVLRHLKIFNQDCTALIDGHSVWKENFGEVLRRLDNG